MPSSKPDERPQNRLRGVVFIVVAMFITSIQDVVYKMFSSELPLGQIFALRAALALPLLIVLVHVCGAHRGVFFDALKPWTLVRSVFMTLCFVAFYAAIPFLTLSTLGAAAFTAPIFVTVFSALIIGETVGGRGWFAVVIGFVGVLILLQPGSDAFSLWTALPLMGACFYALANITTRAKCLNVPLPTMALSLNLTMLSAGLVVSGVALVFPLDSNLSQDIPYLYGRWVEVSLTDWLILSLLAFLAVAISVGIAGAYQSASPPLIATFEYSYLGFVVVWDVVFFAASPSAATIVGMVMIIGAGLVIARRSTT